MAKCENVLAVRTVKGDVLLASTGERLRMLLRWVGQKPPIFPFFPFLLYVEQWAGREEKVHMGTGLGAR